MQPMIPTTTCGYTRLCCPSSPIRDQTLFSATSRTLHVLNSTTSAEAQSSVKP